MSDAGMHFIADVGGTNIRLAVVQNGSILRIEKYLCADFESIADAILHFQDSTVARPFVSACIAIACPTNHDLVKMTNHTWAFSKTELKEALKLQTLHVINDFTAVAHSLPTLSDKQLIQIGGGSAVDKGNIAVFGPGTGLGVEHLTWTGSEWHTLDGEGGHVDFAPTDNTGLIVWQYLQQTFARASAEEVISGRGIVNIYKALCMHNKRAVIFSKPSEITKAGLDGSDPMAVEAISQFCKVMGSFAGNLALNLCTTGGIFIGGGVTRHLGDFFLQSEFRSYFENKGSFSHYVKEIPTYIINEPDHGLLGALAFLNQKNKKRGGSVT